MLNGIPRWRRTVIGTLAITGLLCLATSCAPPNKPVANGNSKAEPPHDDDNQGGKSSSADDAPKKDGNKGSGKKAESPAKNGDYPANGTDEPANGGTDDNSDGNAGSSDGGVADDVVGDDNAVADGGDDTPGENCDAPPPDVRRTIYADVVAIDQPFMINRLGASQPAGMIFVLLDDLVAKTGDGEPTYENYNSNCAKASVLVRSC